MDYKDLQLFRQNFERTLSMIGEMRIEALASEEPARQNARRSLVANANIPAGKIIDKDDLTWKRPAGGISPRHYYEVLGQGRPAPTSRKIPSSSGRIWNKKRMCGKGLEKVPFPPPYPLRVASFPRIPHGRREWRAPATVNGKTIIEHSVRCVSILPQVRARSGVSQEGKRGNAHILQEDRGGGPEGGEKQSQGNLLSGKACLPSPGIPQHTSKKETP